MVPIELIAPSLESDHIPLRVLSLVSALPKMSNKKARFYRNHLIRPPGSPVRVFFFLPPAPLNISAILCYTC